MTSEPTVPIKHPAVQAIPTEPTPEMLRMQMLEISRRLAQWPKRPPSPEALLATIRQLSIKRRISYLTHGDFRLETRFKEMGFDVFDMYHVLEHGSIDGDIEPGENEGEWKVKVIAVPDGTSRKMGVVPIVVKEERLLIKTVEWEDR